MCYGQALVQDAILKFKQKPLEEPASCEDSPVNSMKDRDSLNLLADSRQDMAPNPSQVEADRELGIWDSAAERANIPSVHGYHDR